MTGAPAPATHGRAAASRPPAVTVLVGCYNHARFVQACLDSIEAQTFRDFEVVFIDDCSGDDSVVVAERCLTTFTVPVTLVAHPVNRGICASFNDGLRRSRGPLVAMISGDDTWYPTRLAEHVDAFARADPGVGIVYSDADQIDEQGTKVSDSFIDTRIGERRPEGDLYFELLGDSFLVPLTATVRRAVFRAVGAFDEVLAVEDHDLYLRATNSFTFAYHPATLGSHRTVATSLNRTLAWPSRLRTRVRTYSKFVRQPGARGAAARREQYAALAKLYIVSPASVRGPAIRAAVRQPSARLLGLAALSSLGVPYDVAKQIGRRVLSI